MTITRRHFALFAAAISAMGLRSAKADGIQLITNTGQIVTAGGTVNLRQAAAGEQYLNPQTGQWTTIQGVSNGLQIVNAGGTVNADQSASGLQAVNQQSAQTCCTPGDYVTTSDGCVQFCCTDGSQYLQFCCNTQKKCCGK